GPKLVFFSSNGRTTELVVRPGCRENFDFNDADGAFVVRDGGQQRSSRLALDISKGLTLAALCLLSRGRPGELQNRKNICFGCGVLLTLELAVFPFMVAGTHGLIVPLEKPTSSDFVSFYAAGKLAAAGVPQSAYNMAEHHAAEERATEAGI